MVYCRRHSSEYPAGDCSVSPPYSKFSPIVDYLCVSSVATSAAVCLLGVAFRTLLYASVSFRHFRDYSSQDITCWFGILSIF